MFKLINNNISSSLINVFKFNNQVNCRETSVHRYFLIVIISWFPANFLQIVVPIWNHLPNSCFDGDTLFYFKNQLHNADFSRFFMIINSGNYVLCKNL